MGLATPPLRLVLVAPNISRNMGGEAFKALMIALEWHARGASVIQVTHARVRSEIERDYPELEVVYVEDDWLQVMLHRLRLKPALLFLNAWQLHRAALRKASELRPDVVHFTSPISPVLPYFRMPEHPVVIGPLNGNVSHPAAFSSREPLSKKLGRALLSPTQRLLGTLFPARREALLLVSGGERTMRALMLAGCSRERMIETVDSGVPRELTRLPASRQENENHSFVFLGRLVRYKAADLAIRALARADPRCTLDIIGKGPEEPRLRRLVETLGLQDRVRFAGWLEPGPALYGRIAQYRALVSPSLAEANGIVYQEAMTLGLPVIALRWAGPAQLFEGLDSILIDPGPENAVIDQLAHSMDLLASDPARAQNLSRIARERALRDYGWEAVLDQWEDGYRRVMDRRKFTNVQ